MMCFKLENTETQFFFIILWTDMWHRFEQLKGAFYKVQQIIASVHMIGTMMKKEKKKKAC